MKKTAKLLTALALSACMAASVVCGAGCAGNEPDADAGILDVYHLYAQAAGDDALSYEDWYAELLASAKGAKGDQGEKGEKGDQGDKGEKGDQGDKGEKGDQGEKGEKGDQGEKGEKGDQGEKGEKGDQGEKGEKGDPGKDGTVWLTGEGDPAAEIGKVNDLYLDTSAWNLWIKSEAGWTKLGSLKSEAAVPEEPEYRTVKDFGEITLSSSASLKLPVDDVEDGIYFLMVETQEPTQPEGFLTLSRTPYSVDLYWPGHSLYRGMFHLDNTGSDRPVTEITLKTTSETELSATAKIVAYEQQETVRLGRSVYYVPAPAFCTQAAYHVDPAMLGKKVRVTVYNRGKNKKRAFIPTFTYFTDDAHSKTFVYFSWKDEDQIETDVWQKEFEIPQDKTMIVISCGAGGNFEMEFEIVE